MYNDIFKQNPDLSEVFETTDGNVFYARNAAENHAKTLKDRKITRTTNPSKEVSEVDIDAPENATLGLIQTGEDKDGNPNLKQIVAKVIEGEVAELAVVPVNDANTAELPVESLSPSPEEIASKIANSNTAEVQAKVQETLLNGSELPFTAEIETTKTDESLKNIKGVLEKAEEVKLSPKQQLQADYTQKFGEIPAEQFTKNQLFEAITKGEKLVAQLNND